MTNSGAASEPLGAFATLAVSSRSDGPSSSKSSLYDMRSITVQGIDATSAMILSASSHRGGKARIASPSSSGLSPNDELATPPHELRQATALPLTFAEFPP